MRPLTDEEYYKGVMSFADEPLKEVMDSWMGRNSKATQKARTNQNRREFPGLSAQESEVFLEQHFRNLKTSNPEEGASLVRVLRQAYAQTLADLGSGPEKIPDFVPMPETDINVNINTTERADTESSPSVTLPENIHNLEEAIKTIPNEVRLYFTLLSSFDDETCFEKLVCDVHTRVREPIENFTLYERNVLAVFSMLKDMADLDDTSVKYFTAARNGEKKLSLKFCHATYPRCRYSTTEIMEMGNSLEKAS